MRMILLGAPGAGKGTQATVISKRLGVPTISTGNLIRQAMKEGTELGSQAKGYMESGKLVPDELVIGLLQQRIALPDCANGFILDGFPRTLQQARVLDGMGYSIDLVLDIEVKDEVILERLTGRLVCSSCPATFHRRDNPPKAENVCDICGAELVRRADDSPETVRERLRVYHEQTVPLKNYYSEAGKLRVVEGQDSIDDTSALTLATLEDTLAALEI